LKFVDIGRAPWEYTNRKCAFGPLHRGIGSGAVILTNQFAAVPFTRSFMAIEP
jgi:hypothetical protein